MYDAFLAGMKYLRDEIIARQPKRAPQTADLWRVIADEVIAELEDRDE